MIYLDNASTTPLDSRVLDAMLPYFKEEYGNTNSKHILGQNAHKAVKNSREQIANLINCKPREIIFTSGATEAINMAIKGIAESYQEKGKHIVTVSTEHSAVLNTCKYLEKKGFEVTYLPVKPDGLLDLHEVEKYVRKDTILVSVMYVNNEIGVIQPIKDMAAIAKKNGSLFMTDATQAVGKIPLDVEALGIDLMPFSGHKMYGPKGIGGLYMCRGIKIEPLLHGGGHERGYRSGTLNVPGIVGLGKACEHAKMEMKENELKIKELRDYLENELLKIDDAFINGNRPQRIFNICNIGFKGIDADALAIGMKNVAISKGSACNTDSYEPSHVLKAIGLNKNEANSSIRISLGINNNFEEILEVVEFIIKNVMRIKDI